MKTRTDVETDPSGAAGAEKQRTPLPFNKACEIEDFGHKDLVPFLREACPHKLSHFGPQFPSGFEYNKDWEISMAVRALRHFGALTPDSLILGVAAGKEDTLYLLTRYVRQVFATDRYLFPKEWESLAPRSMMLSPEDSAPFDFDPQRLVVQHMDGRLLRFPDNFFSGIFSSGSIEHFGTLNDVAASAYEMGRVLEPGGVLSLSTVLRCGGTATGPGFPGTLVLTEEEIQRFIIEASGLEPVDSPDFSVSTETIATDRDLVEVLNEKQVRLQAGQASGKPVEDWMVWDFPHVILSHDGYLFDSVHLALTKTDRYLKADNEWARPAGEILNEIRSQNSSFISATTGAPPAGSQAGQESSNSTSPVEREPAEEAQQLLEEVGRRRAQVARMRIAAERHFAGAVARTDAKAAPFLKGAGPSRGDRASRRVKLETAEFVIVLNPRMEDSLSQTYLRGEGESVEPHVLDLFLALVNEGDHVLDLGAFVGTFALPAAAMGAKVVAVEASPENAELLRASTVANRFQNLTVVQAAVGDDPGTVDFYPDGPIGMVEKSGPAGSRVEVFCVRVDDLIEKLGWKHVNLVKLDVEGFELKALGGMRRLLASKEPPLIIFESNGHTLGKFDATPKQLLLELEALGYDSYLIAPKRLVRMRPQDFQPSTVADYLAIRGGRPTLDGWYMEERMAIEEQVERLLFELSRETADHRLYMASALAEADNELLSHQEVIPALHRLQSDPAQSVREAMRWWTGQ